MENTALGTGADRRSVRRQWALLWVGLCLFGVLIAASLFYEHQRITREQFDRLSSKTRVLDENIVRQLSGVNNTLKTALDHDFLVQHGPVERTVADPYLKALADATLGVRSFSILDMKGRVLASSRDQLVGIDFSQREYFSTPASDPQTDVLYLSKPFRTILGVYSMNLVRVKTGPSGGLERVATATLDPDFFSTLMSSVIFESDVWVALAHIDGELVLRYPERLELLGTNLNQPGSFFARHRASGSSATLLTGMSKASGVAGWMAQRTVSAPGLNMRGAMVVAVARNPEAALAPFYLLVQVAVAIWIIVAVSAISALVWFQRQESRNHRLLAESEIQRRKAEEAMRQMAFHDPLTALPNRRLLLDRLGQMQSASLRHRRYSALLFIDLDGFKQLNDTVGHATGDLLLQQVAGRLRQHVRQEDTAARWGGDEFAIALSDLSDNKDEALKRIETVAEKVLTGLAQEYHLSGYAYKCTASIGAALFGLAEEHVGAVFKRADEALYQAKAAGKNGYRISDA